MPNARHALEALARAGDPWPGHRDDWASTEGQGSSQTERAIALRNAMYEGVPVAGGHKTTIRPFAVEGEEKNAGLRPHLSWMETRDFFHVSR
jgi:hypothetical protein